VGAHACARVGTRVAVRPRAWGLRPSATPGASPGGACFYALGACLYALGVDLYALTGRDHVGVVPVMRHRAR
jgi:hypothetical protein